MAAAIVLGLVDYDPRRCARVLERRPVQGGTGKLDTTFGPFPLDERHEKGVR
jgi:hypothetical protein